VVGGDLDQAACPPFWSALEQLLPGATHEVEVELGAVTFMDAAGLPALLRAQRRASEAAARLVLVAPSVAVLRIFDRTHAAPRFEIRL
jgi:anti-sigma B factor antagonist